MAMCEKEHYGIAILQNYVDATDIDSKEFEIHLPNQELSCCFLNFFFLFLILFTYKPKMKLSCSFQNNRRKQNSSFLSLLFYSSDFLISV